MITATSLAARICWSRSMPSMFGMMTSSSTRSGRSLTTTAIAVGASVASTVW